MAADCRDWKEYVNMRMCAVFEKGERLRHIGHLDLMRTVQRSLRRAELPVSYSKGFNPHILLNFASALSVGAIGLNEILDVRLDTEMPPDEFTARFSPACPPDLRILSAQVIPDSFPALMSLVKAGEWEMHVPDSTANQILLNSLPGFLAQKEISTMRQTKSGEKICDIRPSIFRLDTTENRNYRMILEATEGSACKPSMLLQAMCAFAGVDIPRVLFTRIHLLGENEEHQLMPLESLL